MVAVLYACCSKWQLFLPFEFTIDGNPLRIVDQRWFPGVGRLDHMNFSWIRLKRLCICQGGTLPSSHLWYVLWGKVDTNGGYPSFDTSPEKAWYVEPLGFFFRFSLLTIAIRAVSTLNQIWAAKCLTCSSLLLAAKFRCFWVTAHVAACSCLLNFTFLVVSSPCVEFYAGWWFGTFFFSIYWECHNPSWLSYFSEG